MHLGIMMIERGGPELTAGGLFGIVRTAPLGPEQAAENLFGTVILMSRWRS
jgi:hypothetical protein